MIQRIQTVYLLIIALGSGLLAVLPLFTLVPGELATDLHRYSFSYLQVISTTGNTESLFMRNWILMALNILIFIVAILTIYGFKNRSKQQQWCLMLAVLSVFLVLLTLYSINSFRTAIGSAHILHLSWVSVFVVLHPLLALMAKRAIKKDDDLVKSADRLR